MKEEVEWIKIKDVPKCRRAPGRWMKLVQELIRQKGKAVKITAVKPGTAARQTS
jgi:hypothetical protein